MTAEERDELLHDLEHAGVRVLEVRVSRYYLHVGKWEIVAWCQMPAHQYSIFDGAAFPRRRTTWTNSRPTA